MAVVVNRRNGMVDHILITAEDANEFLNAISNMVMNKSNTVLTQKQEEIINYLLDEARD